jgi:hypothetical protein
LVSFLHNVRTTKYQISFEQPKSEKEIFNKEDIQECINERLDIPYNQDLSDNESSNKEQGVNL